VPYSLVLGGASMAASVLGVVAVSDLVGDVVAPSTAEGAGHAGGGVAD
jgi:hypothetical protein